MLYETADRPPKAGSLKEALFLTVWLKRQEQKVQRERIAAQGLIDLALAMKGESHLQEAFQKYVQSVFPFLVDEEKERTSKVKEIMDREARKGVITFSVDDSNPLRRRAETMRMDDDWARKLRERAKRKA